MINSQTSKGQFSVLSKEDRKTSQGYVNIKSKTMEELEELVDRQNKLLKNRLFLKKLPDKGEKIILFKTELENEIKRRENEYNSTCLLMSNLSLNVTNSEDIEWNKGKSGTLKKQINSDDDSDSEADPLKLIATHSGTVQSAKKTVVGNKDYVEKLCEKYGKADKPKERFKPNQLKDNKDVYTTSAEKVKERLGDKWEVTQATPPIPILKDTMIISLTESLALQKEQAERVKILEQKHAAEILIKNMNKKMGDTLPVNNITEYRVPEDENLEDEDVHYLSEDEEKECYVHYSLQSNELES